MELVRRILNASPYLAHVLLREPVPSVEASRYVAYEGAEPGTTHAYRGTFLHVPVRNLLPGDVHTVELPVPAESVGALVFGSMLTLGWA